MKLPASLARFRSAAEGREWLDSLPAIVAGCAAQWRLTVGPPFPDSYVSLALPAVTSGGDEVVLKIQYPDRESTAEAAALSLWDGNGAIRLLAHDADHRALLLERCVPGRYLSTAGPEAGLTVLAGLLPRLWVPEPAGFGTLAAEVERWIAHLPDTYERCGEPFERMLLDEVIANLQGLAATQGDQVLLHQDLHGDNVLSARREPWLVIDPKPLVGEREFGLSPIIRSAEFGHSKEHVLHRLDRLTGVLGLDRDRARLWAAGQAMAWGFEDGTVLPGHIEMARWLLAA
ncbi:MAG: aminoglycoside phosphotransferase family protein [Acidimicrobiia bacterium]|nr:aminoglycoside phosphotransferase family protein [Acidimicrobiia bacterium]